VLVLVTHRGDWCPFCCGQLVALAANEDRFNQAGAEIIAIGADSRSQSDGLAARWGLPFPVLADPDGGLALRGLGLWNAREHGGIAAVGTVVFGPDGQERWRELGRDVADRPDHDSLLTVVASLRLPPLGPLAPVVVGEGEGGPEAFPPWAFDAYFNGARVATAALRQRLVTEDDRREAHRVARLAARYLEAWSVWRGSVEPEG
jgi:peroxiredoxin